MKVYISVLVFILYDTISFGQNSSSIGTVSTVPDSSSNIDTGLIIGIIFGIIGLVGTIYTIISWFNSRKEKKAYRYLFDLAEKNIDKSVTENVLNQKKNEVKRYSDKIIELQEKIEQEIPKQARIAVLKDKYYTQSESLTEIFSSLKKIEKEINLIKLDETIPPEILSEIENEIAPQYILKEKRSKIKNYITVITTASAIISALLPYPFDRWFTFPLLIIAVPFVFQLLKSYLPDDKNKRKFTYTKVF